MGKALYPPLSSALFGIGRCEANSPAFSNCGGPHPHIPVPVLAQHKRKESMLHSCSAGHQRQKNADNTMRTNAGTTVIAERREKAVHPSQKTLQHKPLSAECMGIKPQGKPPKAHSVEVRKREVHRQEFFRATSCIRVHTKLVTKGEKTESCTLKSRFELAHSWGCANPCHAPCRCEETYSRQRVMQCHFRKILTDQ